MGLTAKIQGKLKQLKKETHQREADAFAIKYTRDNGLDTLINSANSQSGSTGVGEYDYSALHSIVRKKKPKYFLECGTGKSTWIIADALKKNFEEFGIEGKVISMESVDVWYKEAESIFPGHLRPFAQIVYSPAITYMHSFIKGTAYTEVPDYPYEIVFVDGPAVKITENGGEHETANMDFIRLLKNTDRKMTALIDYRLRTVLAYGMLFGKNKVQFLKPWNLGIVEDVSGKDLLGNDTEFVPLIERVKSVAEFSYSFPRWIK